jgi:L-alanine-DL-glutamate epimerase-like enolase superfamily enzyme
VRIEHLEAWLVRMTLAEPYSIAYERVEETSNVFLRLVTERFVDLGCAAPDLPVTGETAASVQQALTEVAEPVLVGADAMRWGAILEQLRTPLKAHPAARAAIDMALLDLLGKLCDRPLWQLLGGFRDRIETSVTIGILPEPETVDAARAHVRAGFRCLKIKGGVDVDSDIARVLRIRETVGEAVEIRFDANQGYSLEESLRFVAETKRARLELLEQPTARGQADLLGRVTAAVEIPMMADESLMTLCDAFRLAGRDLVDMVNVKLMKVGGIAEALHINSVARAARMETMVGCMDESEVAIAAGLAFALSRPNVAYADLDGHLDLEGDPASGSLLLRDGVLHAPTGAGLGVEFQN